MTDFFLQPSWDRAPAWAQFVAMDSDGRWWWYENNPSRGEGAWRNNGRMAIACEPSDQDWTKSCRPRP